MPPTPDACVHSRADGDPYAYSYPYANANLTTDTFEWGRNYRSHNYESDQDDSRFESGDLSLVKIDPLHY